ncbi:Dabb family protein [Mesorhizobium sp. CO1-1-8]|uniref:Dabb family protein n=1 Tax=Mesorhizobium sp. CO1-1-8 TaxID=2876631 RepID=UPI001CD13293|nr:Dabb family protein [Mesorhizobium sp. CO1-1-8]MBZ9775825.1 Dabb family protein [Mesorhizobium sp. CO1-1-8]
MIRHCVFIKFRTGVAATERTAIHADLEALRQVIDGMDAVKFSANVSPEPFAHGFTHGFTIDFRDAAARDAYLAHEAHQRAGARLVAALEGGTDGLMVFDLEI